VAGGTQVVAPVTAPVTVSGNAVSVLGDSRSSGCGTTVAPGAGGSNGAGSASTSGEDSVAGGTQVVAPVTAPVTVGGNAVSVVGDSTTDRGEPATPVEAVDTVDPTGPGTTAVEAASSGAFGTASPRLAAMVAAGPAATSLAQTGTPAALLGGVALLLLLVGGLLTHTGRRVPATG
jgi:hypothetical protein